MSIKSCQRELSKINKELREAINNSIYYHDYQSIVSINEKKVAIDKKIVPIIKKLNEKGYVTTDCCSGHTVEEYGSIYSSTPYISFKKDSAPTIKQLQKSNPCSIMLSDYKIKGCEPKISVYWELCKNDTLPTTKDIDDLMNKLNKWVDSLKGCKSPATLV